MAISVRDIQEKEFATQAKGGYSVEEVDDFLDEIAEQMTALVRENVALNQQVAGLKADVEAANRAVAEAKQAAAEAEAKTPEYNERGYFDNLQKSMREAMIGAQRIADETVAEAQSQAQQMKADAQNEADATVGKAQRDAERITADAQAKLESLKEQYETMKASAASFKADFSRMLEEHASLLKDRTGLF